jgi:nucleoid-associated protein YejK
MRDKVKSMVLNKSIWWTPELEELTIRDLHPIIADKMKEKKRKGTK